ncbi:MAG: hypothetical protein HQL55_12760 [Magnetococcales bacterium]|nr:hypothetical protein [Magnetococcales bacterium]
MQINTFADAAPLAGLTFSMVLADDCHLTLLLTEVKDMGPGHDYPGKIRTPFALSFQGTRNRYCPQGLYTLTHPEVGAVELFLVPLAFDKDTVDYFYHALFN